MTETLLSLLTAHLLGDFIFQTSWIVNHKKQWNVLLFHVFLITAISCLLLGTFHWIILLAIFLSHAAMDAIKVHQMKDTFWTFVIDQGVHLLVLVVLACAFPDAVTNSAWSGSGNELKNGYYTLLSIVSGLIIAVPLGGILIGKAMVPLLEQLNKEKLDGLINGGKYIGLLERFLIFLFILMGSVDGVGFLLGAKSILRFGEIQNQEDRKVTEYIIIGTFFSFGWGICMSEMTKRLLEIWQP